MVGMLEGKVHSVRAGYAIVLADSVGYKVAMTRETLGHLPVGKRISLWTHLAVREDSLDLYGFMREEELVFFELLLTVSGIGPKSALAILDIASVESLRGAIAAGKAEYLTRVSGIGRKTSEKIVLELRDKIGTAEGVLPPSGDMEALEALRALGYEKGEARDALRKVPTDIEGSSKRLREALKILGER